jgi:hypothetical protein
MHQEILTKEQNDLLPLIGQFSDDFGLVGGTAVALYLGHRRSVDFDLSSKKEFGNQSILNRISKFGAPDQVIVNKLDELTLTIKGVKLTFFHYPYEIKYGEEFGYRIKLPDLLTLASMKRFLME